MSGKEKQNPRLGKQQGQPVAGRGTLRLKQGRSRKEMVRSSAIRSHYPRGALTPKRISESRVNGEAQRKVVKELLKAELAKRQAAEHQEKGS